jgi:hypothetical protein
MKDNNRYFKVKFGYSVSDQVSIGEKELEKAVYAQITGTPIQLGTSYVNGRNIISISPHYHKHTGWYDYYEPTTGEDFEQIKRDCPDYTGIVEHSKERVDFLIKNRRVNEIGKGVSIPELDRPMVENYPSLPPDIKKQIGDISSKFKI